MSLNLRRTLKLADLSVGFAASGVLAATRLTKIWRDTDTTARMMMIR